jgi:hypothetical protein
MVKSARQILWPSRHRAIWVTAYAVVALLGLSTLAYFTVIGTPGPATSGSPAAVSAPASHVPTATPGSPGNGGQAGNGAQAGTEPMTTKNRAGAAAWNAGHGGAALAAVSGQLGTTLMTHAARQFLLMRQACATLAADVRSAQQSPPIPDTAMETAYKRALAGLGKAAAECRAAISSHQEGVEDVEVHENTALLDEATSGLSTGAKDLYLATETIKTMKR